MGYDTGNLGDVLGNDLDVNIMIGSDFYISTKIVGSPSYWATLSLRLFIVFSHIIWFIIFLELILIWLKKFFYINYY